MKRENGFYWVMINGEWIVSEYVTDSQSGRTEYNWSDTRRIGYWHESQIEEIFEERILNPLGK